MACATARVECVLVALVGLELLARLLIALAPRRDCATIRVSAITPKGCADAVLAGVVLRVTRSSVLDPPRAVETASVTMAHACATEATLVWSAAYHTVAQVPIALVMVCAKARNVLARLVGLANTVLPGAVWVVAPKQRTVLMAPAFARPVSRGPSAVMLSVGPKSTVLVMAIAC